MRWNCVDGIYGLWRVYLERPGCVDVGRRELVEEPVKLMLLFNGEPPPANDVRDGFPPCKATLAARSNSVIFEPDNEGCEVEGN